MNHEQAAETLRALAGVWPPLGALEPQAMDLWYRVAFRHCAAEATDTKPGALEVVDRLAATMTYQPKPADWVRVQAELAQVKRRRTEHTITDHTEPPDPEAHASTVASMRAMIEKAKLRRIDEEFS